MKNFECQCCNNAVYFDNTTCMTCGSALGFVAGRNEMTALRFSDGWYRAVSRPQERYVYCENAQHNVCNWLVAPNASPAKCEACRHNRAIPDLSVPGNLIRWQKIELAKRYLFYSLIRWALPVPDRFEAPDTGLAFDFLGDATRADGAIEKVLTGHDSGLITINIAEADDAEREMRRTSIGEPYRAIIGHFRHEIGHYYWERLVRDRGRLDQCRALFGDDRLDYASALKAHYQNGVSGNWQSSFISAYATAHPWEDFAETWAHYMHIVDGLETARAFGVKVRKDFHGGHPAETQVDFDPYYAANVPGLIEAWVPLTVAMNTLNRSMGQPDLYPFVVSPPVVAKLQFVHDLIHTG